MPFHRPQPLDLRYAPARYPGHGYVGLGEVVRVHLGDETVGFLTRQGEAVGWTADAPPDTDAGIVRGIVNDRLRAGALAGRPLEEVWDEVLAVVLHDPPYMGDLAEVAEAARRE